MTDKGTITKTSKRDKVNFRKADDCLICKHTAFTSIVPTRCKIYGFLTYGNEVCDSFERVEDKS